MKKKKHFSRHSCKFSVSIGVTNQGYVEITWCLLDSEMPSGLCATQLGQNTL